MSEKILDLMEKIVSLCKRRGFIYPSSEIYGGFSGFWNYGHYGTILKDNPKLTTHLEGLNHKITRIILDTNLKMPMDAKVLEGVSANPVWIFYKSDPENKAAALEKVGVKLFQSQGQVKELLQKLAEGGITRLLVEGGAKVW